ncbi:MAG: NADP-dependent oxidoreductase [Mesorhizobium sp.]
MFNADRNRQIFFARRPDGPPTADVFGQRDVEVPVAGEGELLCRNIAMSIDPYLRLKMYDRRSYTPPLKIDELIPGRNIAVVVESRAPGYSAGDHVAVSSGWQDFAVVRARAAKKVDLAAASAGAWLGPLGMTGMTAYTSLFDIGKPRADETLVVSGAAGAVGSVVGQIGKALGCRVVGIAGGEEKCAVVAGEFGFDACVNYRAADFEARLAKEIGGGCDIYFDNVGGAISRSVIGHFNDFGRMIVCGLISQYSGQQAAEATAHDELFRLVLTRRLTVRGFIVSDFAPDAFPNFESDMNGWLRDGKVVFREHTHSGFDRIVPAFMDMLSGGNTGKTIVHVGDE